MRGPRGQTRRNVRVQIDTGAGAFAHPTDPQRIDPGCQVIGWFAIFAVCSVLLRKMSYFQTGIGFENMLFCLV
jgi:hypothetical protein